MCRGELGSLPASTLGWSCRSGPPSWAQRSRATSEDTALVTNQGDRCDWHLMGRGARDAATHPINAQDACPPPPNEHPHPALQKPRTGKVLLFYLILGYGIMSSFHCVRFPKSLKYFYSKKHLLKRCYDLGVKTCSAHRPLLLPAGVWAALGMSARSLKPQSPWRLKDVLETPWRCTYLDLPQK